MIFHDAKDEGMIIKYIESYIRNKDLNLLSIGCGDMSIERALYANNSNLMITGIDVLPLTHIDNVRYICADALTFNYGKLGAKFDLIYSFSFCQYITETQINNLNKLLVPLLVNNGHLIHFAIPDKRKKKLYKKNRKLDLNRHSNSSVTTSTDFIDEQSRWIDLNKLRIPENTDMYLSADRLYFERFVQHIIKS